MLQGNGNNFLSLAACYRACRPMEEDLAYEKDRSQDEENSEDRKSQDTKGSVDSDEGNVEEEEMKASKEVVRLLPLSPGPAGGPGSVCSQPAAPGPCGRNLIRFHYNTSAATCQPFQYGQ